jgi:hypothetical protein
LTDFKILNSSSKNGRHSKYNSQGPRSNSKEEATIFLAMLVPLDDSRVYFCRLPSGGVAQHLPHHRPFDDLDKIQSLYIIIMLYRVKELYNKQQVKNCPHANYLSITIATITKIHFYPCLI